MRRRAPLLAAALVAATLSTAPSPGPAAAQEVDITPPAVGSCHDLTMREAAADADPEAPVDCSAPHTTVTVAVLDLGPDHDFADPIPRKRWVECLAAFADALGGDRNAVSMSAFTMYHFFPTEAQQDAGAKWVRCDAVLAGGRQLQPLPTDGAPLLGDLPLPKDVARCWLEDREGWWQTVCSRRHDYRAKVVVPHRDGPYPGNKALERWALKKCRARMDAGFWFIWSSRSGWQADFRNAVCISARGGAIDSTSTAPGIRAGQVGMAAHPAVHGDRGGR